MADKCIGNLTLNTKGVEDAVKKVNELLADLGVGKKVNISSKVTAAVRESMKDVENLLQQSEKRIAETAEKAAKAIENIGKTKISDEANIDKMVNALKDYYNALNKVEQAKRTGNKGDEALYGNLAEKALAAAKALEEENKGLREQAEAYAVVQRAKISYESSINKTVAKTTSEETKEIEKATQAYIKLEQAKSKMRLAEDQYGRDSVEFAKAAAEVQKLQTAFDAYSKQARTAAGSSNEVSKALDNIARSETDLSAAIGRRQSEKDQLDEIKQKYFEIKDAVQNYNIAKKAGDETGMANAQARVDATMQEVAAIQQTVEASNMEAGVKRQILNICQQCATAQAGVTQETQHSVNASSDLQNQVTGLLTRYLSLMAVIRTVSNLINNMVDYVSEYSDKMNEIQMITMKSDGEVAQLAERYRDIAKEMSVSSLDMADAAIYFTRQGLNAADIEKRLVNVTQYAKAANVEFENASEIITAVVNSMGLVAQEAEDGREAAQRVADVFLNIGDNAATSGQEIGEAMQKAAASAGSFGVSMEWLAAYIATVSETTRQEARTIGTAFNTIIARLHQIKQTGYNQEDETKVNDIAKALSKIDVVLMDQAGNWRDMETILEEIAAKWGELDGKTKSYIATTMAGVKQQNVFLALMNDMSKGVENGSRAFELHELAMNSDGVAAQKYAVYLDSVAASQERLTVAQEKFYSILSQDVIIGWNNALASVVNMIADGAEALDGVNLILPLVVAGITGVTVAIKLMNTGLGETTSILTMLSNHPIMAALGAAIAIGGALTLIISGIGDQIETTQEKFNRANNTLSESGAKIQAYASMQEQLNSMMESLGEKTDVTAEDLNEYNGLLESLAAVSPTANQAVNDLRNGMIGQKEAADVLNGELERLIANEQKVSMFSLRNKYDNWTPGAVNEGASGVYQNWNLSDFESTEAMANAVRTRWGATSDNRAMRGRWFTQDMIDYINKELKDLQDMGSEKWEIIAQGLWEDFFFGGDSGDIAKQITDEANAMIDEVVNTIGSNLGYDQVQKDYMGKYLRGVLFGEDGELDLTEYKDIGEKIKQFVEQVMAHGFDISGAEELRYLGDRLFGNYFDLLFGDQLKELTNSSEFDEIAKNITNAFSELLSAGFDEDAIRNLLSGLNLDQWEFMVEEMSNRLRESIKKNAGVSELGILVQDALTGEESFDTGMWDELDVATLKYINDLLLAGVQFHEIQLAMATSGGSAEELRRQLEELSDVKFGEQVEEQAYSIKDSLKTINASVKEIQTLDEAIKDIRENKNDFNVADMLGLVEAHPEILTVINDSEKLLETLRKIRAEASDNQRNELRNAIMNAAPMGDYAGSGFETMQAVRDSLVDQTEITAFDAAVEQMINIWQRANVVAEKTAETAKEKAKEEAEILAEAQKIFKDNISEVETLDKAISKIQENKGIDFSDILSLSTAHPEIIAFANDAERLATVLEDLKTKAQGTAKSAIKDILFDSEDYFKGTQYYDPNSNIKTMREYIDYLHESREAWYEVAAEVDAAAQNILDAANRTEEAAETWLEAQDKIIRANEELNWAKSNNFAEQLGSMNVFGGEEDEADWAESAAVALDRWNNLDEAMQKSIAETYPGVIKALQDVEEAEKNLARDGSEPLVRASKELQTELSKIERRNSAKYFKSTYDAITKLEKGTISATNAYETFNSELDNLSKAQEDINNVTQKTADGISAEEKDVSNLAKALGLSAKEVLQDYPEALNLFDEMIRAGQQAYNELNKEAVLRITGMSEADFSAIENGLLAIQSDAQATIALLKATGQWEVETENLPQEGKVFVPDGVGSGHWETFTNNAKVTFLKPTGNNPFGNFGGAKSGGGAGGGSSSAKSGGGGGGGGGGSSNDNKNRMTEVELALNRMEQVREIQDYQRSFYQAQNSNFEQNGYLQGVISASEKEIDLLLKQNDVLESNIATIEKYMAAKRKEIASMETTDENYEEVRDDLDKLQKAHQNYTKELLENKTAIDQLNEAIDEQRNKIRDMEIELRETIYKAIEDREKKKQRMLENEISMENTILDLIKRRYELERDRILESTDARIDALSKERDLLSEQLQLRREMAEKEDKAAKLAQLEENYQRILADPTRAKEAQKIQEQISDLREEMAWQAAEDEVKAQQDSLDQQVTSLEDYRQYIEEYYEDLFAHPQKLIEEMRQIITGTDEEILEWLKTNSEEFAASSENTQKQMVSEWQQTLDDMHGRINTYWDEVEEIIAGGDEAIVQFLIENSDEYARAGELQAQKYVDEWKKQLEDLKKAREAVFATDPQDYNVLDPANGEGSSGSGGGGGGGGSGRSGGGSGGASNDNNGSTVYYRLLYGKDSGNRGDLTADWVSGSSLSDIQSKVYSINRAAGKEMYILSNQKSTSRPSTSGRIYEKGGIADYTGLAWLDGSPTDPERILTPYQNKLFETMVQALERMSRISIPSMPNIGGVQTGSGSNVSVGDIIVNVDNLDTDDDYEELAERVSSVLMERIGRTAVIGGLRINPT